jgi:hypothetical protein
MNWHLSERQYDYVIAPTVLNHITLSADRYINLGLNKTMGQGWNQQLGVNGIPSDIGEFPQIGFSGGQVSPNQLNRAYDETWHDLRYSVIENLTWVRGRHAMKFGADVSRDRINRFNRGNASGTLGFTSQMTSQTGANLASYGNSYASFLLGAVNSASAYMPVVTGMRFVRFAAFAQDEFRVSSKVTLSYGLRWDYMPAYNEVNDKLSSFLPTLANPGAGNRPGALAFVGTGAGRIGGNFVNNWKKAFGPRLGISYQMNEKTVFAPPPASITPTGAAPCRIRTRRDSAVASPTHPAIATRRSTTSAAARSPRRSSALRLLTQRS